MAHEFESGFFVGQSAWHKLGRVLPEAPSVGEALELAGLTWSVQTLPAFLQDGRRIPGCRAIVRCDTGAVLGHTGRSWRPYQNVQMLEAFAPLVNAGAVKLETAGSLRGGARVWVLARLQIPDGDVGDGDTVRPYLLLSQGHDGRLAVGVQFTAVRVVCANTLRMARDVAADQILRIRHSARTGATVDAVMTTVDALRGRFAIDVDAWRAMRRAKLDTDGLRDYVRALWQTEAPETPRAFEPIEQAFYGAPGAVPGTVWGGYQAVTHHLTHTSGRTPETRLNSLAYGDGARRLEQAHALAVQLTR